MVLATWFILESGLHIRLYCQGFVIISLARVLTHVQLLGASQQGEGRVTPIGAVHVSRAAAITHVNSDS